MALAIKHHIGPNLNYVSTLREITQITKSYVVFLSV